MLNKQVKRKIISIASLDVGHADVVKFKFKNVTDTTFAFNFIYLTSHTHEMNEKEIQILKTGILFNFSMSTSFFNVCESLYSQLDVNREVIFLLFLTSYDIRALNNLICVIQFFFCFCL